MTKTNNTKFADVNNIRILCLGLGVDSVAMLVGMLKFGWDAPDMIIFSDTGAEKPETLAYLATINAWLRNAGWPEVTVVKYVPERATYTTLDELCLVNETLPSLAFGGHSCSLRFKVEVIDRFLNGVTRGANKAEGALPMDSRRGKSYTVKNDDGTKSKKFHDTKIKATKYIGYDNGKTDIRRANKGKRVDHQFSYEYPLQGWGWEREQCIAEIKAAGLPVPIKSACFMCPASHKWELMWLAARHPELFIRALLIEDTARDGKHGLKTAKGLGRNWSWREWAETEGIVAAGGTTVIADATDLLARAAALKPTYESNDCSSKPCFDDVSDSGAELVQISGRGQLSLFAA